MPSKGCAQCVCQNVLLGLGWSLLELSPGIKKKLWHPQSHLLLLALTRLRPAEMQNTSLAIIISTEFIQKNTIWLVAFTVE